MADERFGGMLRPYGGENPALKGLLGMMERQPASFSTENGREAVDKMLSESDPSLRFKVYRRSMASCKGDSKRSSSGSFSHWLFISDDGKQGFGFNQEGEELELPENLEGYELHPSFKKSYMQAVSTWQGKYARNRMMKSMRSLGITHGALLCCRRPLIQMIIF